MFNIFVSLFIPNVITGYSSSVGARRGWQPVSCSAKPLNRISFLRTSFAAISSGASIFVPTQQVRAANGILAQKSTSTGALYGTVDKIDDYLSVLRSTRTALLGNDSPNQKRKIVLRTLDRSARPMLDAMFLNELSLDLSEEQLMRCASLPLSIKQHISALTEIVQDDANFDNGGKVDAELKAIIDETVEYLLIARVEDDAED